MKYIKINNCDNLITNLSANFNMFKLIKKIKVEIKTNDVLIKSKDNVFIKFNKYNKIFFKSDNLFVFKYNKRLQHSLRKFKT